MKKYIGTYRVVCEFDRGTLKPILDDTFIPCAGEGQIYRYDRATLVYWNPKGANSSWLPKFKEAGVTVTYSWSDETEIRFAEADLDKVAKLVKARKRGSSIKPYDKENLKLQSWYKERV